ncbi:MAG: nucleotidyltransferase domain-containing protein [Chloroflexi bacterium]|nr:nucleotidyltransferase domain-containing protein [Chloroflexota bacterium]
MKETSVITRDEKGLATYRKAWQRRWRKAEARRRERATHARAAAEACARFLVESYHVHRVYLFGSLAGWSPLHDRSDIDLAVEGLPPGRAYIQALTTLWSLLPPDTELDLVPIEDARPSLASRIPQEGILLYDGTTFYPAVRGHRPRTEQPKATDG